MAKTAQDKSRKPRQTAMSSTSTGIAADEQAKFAALAATWWDADGPMKPLHMINPVRLDFLQSTIKNHFAADLPTAALPKADFGFAPPSLKNLTILDIGCAAGLTSVPLARLGADVLGIDATPDLIAAAKAHVDAMGALAPQHIQFENVILENIDKKQKFDVVLALEVVEHVENPPDFLQAAAQRVKPGGLLILSTLNRNFKSWALGIMAAEYLLRWLPRGTHQWQKFIRPSEMVTMLRGQNLALQSLVGLVYDPWRREFAIKPHDVDVNYLAVFEKS